MAGIFNSSIFNNAIFNTGDGIIPPVVIPPVGGSGPGKGVKRKRKRSEKIPKQYSLNEWLDIQQAQREARRSDELARARAIISPADTAPAAQIARKAPARMDDVALRFAERPDRAALAAADAAAEEEAVMLLILIACHG